MREFQEAVAVFDLDGTITRSGTFSPFLLYSAINRPWRFVYVPFVIAMMLIHKAGWLSRSRLKELMLQMVTPRCRDEMTDRSRKFAAFLIARGLRPKARSAIDKHREAGHFLVMVTASMDFYAEEIGRQLGFHEVVSTPSVWDAEDCLIAKLGGENCYGDAKLPYLAARLAKLDGSLAGFERYAYTDHISDAPLLTWATKPQVVHPKKKMQALAQEMGYSILDWD
jgi:HAD superfamily hydrolase (TIGR01490 family)